MYARVDSFEDHVTTLGHAWSLFASVCETHDFPEGTHLTLLRVIDSYDVCKCDG
jgi:hypothetical protein